MKISARNQLKGKILEVKKGATTAHVRLEIAPGQVVTSSITNEAVDELGLKVAVSGLGGDELFGGYPSFREIPRWVNLFAIPSRIPL